MRLSLDQCIGTLGSSGLQVGSSCALELCLPLPSTFSLGQLMETKASFGGGWWQVSLPEARLSKARTLPGMLAGQK